MTRNCKKKHEECKRSKNKNENEAFSKMYNLLCGKLKLLLRKRLIRCFVWRVLLFGQRNIKKMRWKILEAYEMQIGESRKTIGRHGFGEIDRNKKQNDGILSIVKEKRTMLMALWSKKETDWFRGKGY